MTRTDLYPTGRKHCAQCGAYRHVCYFGRHHAKDKRERGVLSPYCHTCRRRFFREYRTRPQAREYSRIRAEALRRRAGVDVVIGNRRTPQGHDERVLLPAAPFAEWLREHGPMTKGERVRWCLQRSVDESGIRRIIEGEKLRVHIDTVDRCVDPAVLNELYPV